MILRIFTLIGLLGILLFSTCKKENNGLFDVPMQVDFTVRSGWNTFETYYIPVENIPNTVATLIRQNNLKVEDITSINPKAATITSIFDNQDFNIFREVSVEIYPVNGNPDRSKEAFYRDPVPENTGKNLNMIATLIDGKDILTQERFSLRIRVELREIPRQFVESRLSFTFVVK